MKVVDANKAAQTPNPHRVDARNLHANDHVQVMLDDGTVKKIPLSAFPEIRYVDTKSGKPAARP